MSNLSRHALLGLLLALGLNHFVLGMMWLASYRDSGPVLLAFALYLISLIFSIYGVRTLQLPKSQAYLNLAIAVVAPILVLTQLSPSSVQEGGSYQTWFVGALSLVLSITSARGYPLVGWLGTAAIWVEVIVWGGVGVITTSGLIGALIMVITAWAMGRGLRSTEAAAADYHRQAAELKARAAKAEAARTSRNELVKSALVAVSPMLERIVAQDGQLSDLDRQEAILLEARFRDGIQGNQLLSDGVQHSVREARKRGVEVNLMDHGGMAHLDTADIGAIHESISQALDATLSGKVNVTAPANESYAVSIVATRPDAAGPDLWLRLP